MRGYRHILVVVLCSLFLVPAWAKKPVAHTPVLTVEQEQQFTYYWYAAKQAIEEERYADAYALLEFCRLINPNDAQTTAFLGVLYNGMGQKARARQTYRRAFELAPGDQWFRYSDVLFKSGTKEDRKEAIRVCETAFKQQKESVKNHKRNQVENDLLEMLRKAYMEDGQWKKALAIQDEIDRVTGFDDYSAYYRYRIYVRWGKTKKAIEVIDRYIEQDPTDVRFLKFRIELLEYTKAPKEDIYRMYDRVLEVEPYNLEILNSYAYMIATQGGDLKKAERMSAITIREEPNSPYYLDTYGWILHLQNQDDLALFYLKRALWNAAEEAVRAEIEKHMRQISK